MTKQQKLDQLESDRTRLAIRLRQIADHIRQGEFTDEYGETKPELWRQIGIACGIDMDGEEKR